MQNAEYLLMGFLAALAIVLGGGLLWVLHRAAARLESIDVQVKEIRVSFREATSALNLVAQQTAVLRSLVDAFRMSLATMGQTTEAIRGLSGLLVSTPGGAPEPPPLWTRGAPPPNPAYENYAAPGDAGFIEQNDEDLAEIERQNLLREQGIETDPLRIAQPGIGAINLTEL